MVFTCAVSRTVLVKEILLDVLGGRAATQNNDKENSKWMWMHATALQSFYELSRTRLFAVTEGLPLLITTPLSAFALVRHYQADTSTEQAVQWHTTVAQKLRLQGGIEPRARLAIFYDNELFADPIGITRLWLRTEEDDVTDDDSELQAVLAQLSPAKGGKDIITPLASPVAESKQVPNTMTTPTRTVVADINALLHD